MNILHTVPSLALSDGGPPRSVSQLCNNMSDLECRVSILTALYPNDPIVGLSGAIRLKTVTAQSKNLVGRLTADSFTGELKALHESGAADVIHHHGVWLRCTNEVATYASRHEIPYVISPRGMLEPWALNHSKWVKKFAWKLYAQKCCEGASAFHATAESEAESIRRLGLKQPIVVLPNGIELPTLKQSSAIDHQSSAKKTALYLSRINPKKGLPMLLDAWKKVAPIDWRLVIAGNDDSHHLPTVKSKINELKLEGSVEVVGPLFGENQVRAYQNADVFVLPSYSENFGIVVAEALGHQLPVLTTTGCPWKELETEQCGWWVEPTPTGIELGLQRVFLATDFERQEMGVRGRFLVESKYQWPSIAERMIIFYEWLLNGGKQPDFVI